MPSPPNKPLDDPDRRYRRVYADTHLLLLAFFAAVLIAAPGFMPRLLGEDSWVEIPTALLAAAAAVMAFLAAARSRTRRERTRCIAFGALFLFVLGEENDWGIRLFMRRNMVRVGEVGSGREVNLNTVHELLFEVAPSPGVDTTLRVLAVVIALVLVIAVAAVLITGTVKLWPPDRRTWDRAQRLALVGCLLIALGQLRDLGFTPQIGLGPKFPEEVLEFFGALSLFFAGWSLLLAAEAETGEATPHGRGFWAAVSGFFTDP
jgi:cytochrome bd-type quinol oxidase subunit 2